MFSLKTNNLMKQKLLLFVFLTSSILYAQENFNIEIDGKLMSIELDKNYEVLINKKKVNFKVTIKDSITYDVLITENEISTIKFFI
jgi:hypothetical protein